MVDILIDIKTAIVDTCYGDVKTLKEKINLEWGGVNKWLEGSKFVVGDYVTFVDFTLYELMNLWNTQLIRHTSKLSQI